MRRFVAISAFMLAVLVLTAQPSDAVSITIGALQDAAVFNDSEDGQEHWFFYTDSGATSLRGLIQFDLSALAGLYVQSATLRVYHDGNNVDGAVMNFYRNTSAWDEDLVDYATLPTTAPGAVSTLTMTGNTTFLYRTFDLTSVVQGWRNGNFANHGLTLIQTPDGMPSGDEEDSQEYWAYFASSNNPDEELRPMLLIEASPVPEPATILLLGTGLAAAIRARRRSGR